MQTIDLVMIGFGNVGRAFAALLLEKSDLLTAKYKLDLRVVGILTGRHGGALDSKGIDLANATRLVEEGRALQTLSRSDLPETAVQFIKASGGNVMLENTPVDYATGQPAISHIEAALESGMHAITANKGPVVHAYRQLTELAAKNDRKFYFESTVMDGAPIFSLWRHGLPGARLISFRAVLNSTTNLILTLMEQGRSFDEAVSHAQDIGIAETDPSGDIDGWDAAVKVAALTTVLMDHPLVPADVDREGIRAISFEDVQQASESGRRWKLVCEVQRTERALTARVRPQEIDPGDPLYNVIGTSSAITFHSDVLGALTVLEENPGPHTTAYGLLADLLNAVTPTSGII